MLRLRSAGHSSASLVRASFVCFLASALACSPPTPTPGGSAPQAPSTAVVANASATPTASSTTNASSSSDAGTTTTSAQADASAPPAARGPLNVVLITIDSLRADMPWQGYERAIAPNLTALAKTAVTYTHAYSTSSFTSKSVAGILSGRYPSTLARTGRFFTKYLDENTFMCESLATRGIPCVGAHAHAYFGKGLSGFEQGFEDWRLVPDIPFDYNKDPYVTSHKLTPLAIEVVDKVAQKKGPFFAWFHYMDPHDEYKPHAESPKFGKKARDVYDEEVFYTDLWIGKFLEHVKAQPWAANTAIVVTADHGEGFGEHGFWRHAHEVWEPLVRVPLFVILPGQAPRTIAEPRGAADLVPTFLELLGAPADATLPGTSLVSELRGGAAAPRDVVIDLPEDEYNDRRRALVHGRYKLVVSGNDARFQLFDLETDPGENQDLMKTKKEVADDMRDRYKKLPLVDVAPKGGIPKH